MGPQAILEKLRPTTDALPEIIHSNIWGGFTLSLNDIHSNIWGGFILWVKLTMNRAESHGEEGMTPPPLHLGPYQTAPAVCSKLVTTVSYIIR